MRDPNYPETKIIAYQNDNFSHLCEAIQILVDFLAPNEGWRVALQPITNTEGMGAIKLKR